MAIFRRKRVTVGQRAMRFLVNAPYRMAFTKSGRRLTIGAGLAGLGVYGGIKLYRQADKAAWRVLGLGQSSADVPDTERVVEDAENNLPQAERLASRTVEQTTQEAGMEPELGSGGHIGRPSASADDRKDHLIRTIVENLTEDQLNKRSLRKLEDLANLVKGARS